MNAHNDIIINQPDVIVAGLAVVDIIGRIIDSTTLPEPGGLSLIDSIKLSSGGNAANVGIDLSMLGFQAGAITRIGDDELGRFLLNEFETHKIDTSGFTIDRDNQTASTIVCVAGDGERSFLHTRGCLIDFRADDILKNLPLIGKSRIFAFGYLGLLPEMEPDFGRILKTIKEETNCRTLLDTGGKPDVSLQKLKSLLPYVDYFVPSYDEAGNITGRENPEEIIAFFRDAGARGIVGVKMGKDGCIISDMHEIRYIAGEKVNNVIDTTGAGDAFIAGFIAAILKRFNPFEAAGIGNRVAADCITALGASTAIQSFDTYSS